MLYMVNGITLSFMTPGNSDPTLFHVFVYVCMYLLIFENKVHSL